MSDATETDIVDRLRAPMNILQADDITYEAAEEIERLRAERDEARRMYCGRVSRDVPLDAFGIAKNHGWDCFPQEDEPCSVTPAP
jgi:hypothetical protein